MSKETKNIQIGPGFAGTLTIVFIALKLLGYITWPWIWVLAPMWVGLVIGLTILLIVLFIIALIDA